MKIVKSAFVFGLMAVGLLTGGCRIYPPMDPRVTVADNAEGDVYVADVRCLKTADNIMTYQVNVLNRTSSELWLDWKVIWLDAAGQEIDSIVSTWNSLAVAPRDVKGLKGTAPRSDAADMRFYIRRTVR